MMTQAFHVVFGTGPLGVAAAQALLQRGHRVRMVSRSGQADLVGVEAYRADANDPQAVYAACEGAVVVYQCAQPAYHRWVEEFPALQASIIEGVARAGAKLVAGENLYMYGPVSGPLREDLAYSATTRKGAVRARMAEALLAAHREGKLRATAGRGADFYGPGVLQSALGERALGPALLGKAASGVGKLDLAHSFTYIGDFGEALAVLGERDEALGRAWHVPHAATLTQRELLSMLFAELGKPPKITTVGANMLRLVGLFSPGAREMVEMMYQFEQPFVVDCSAYVSAFGDHSTPHAEALRATIAWYRAHLAGTHLAAA